MIDIDATIDALAPEDRSALLKHLLGQYCTPAFGALPKREVDLMFFTALRKAGIIKPDASLYQLMSDLRVTRTRARNLIFDVEIRRTEAASELDAEVRRVILSDSYFKDAAYFMLEVENPVIQAHLREICRKAKVITDASFNPSIVKLPVSGLSDVLLQLLTEAERETVRAALVKAGTLEDTSLRGVFGSALRHLATKFAGKAVGDVVDQTYGAFGEFLKPIFEARADDIEDLWSALFQSS